MVIKKHASANHPPHNCRGILMTWLLAETVAKAFLVSFSELSFLVGNTHLWVYQKSTRFNETGRRRRTNLFVALLFTRRLWQYKMFKKFLALEHKMICTFQAFLSCKLVVASPVFGSSKNIVLCELIILRLGNTKWRGKKFCFSFHQKQSQNKTFLEISHFLSSKQNILFSKQLS